MALEIPLAWERLLWTSRPVRPGGHGIRYILTDFRLVRMTGDEAQEVALYDVTEIRCSQSRVDRLFGTWTLVVATARTHRALMLTGLRRGIQLAALLEILAGEPQTTMDADAVRAALDWQPHRRTTRCGEAAAGIAAVVIAIAAVAHLLHGTSTAAAFAADDPIYSHGEKRSQAEIVAFMEQEVMPWARITLGRIKGGSDRITCQTCHGGNAEALGWQMPAVAVLPQPDLRHQGWEIRGGAMDAQIRNAIYGYLADADNQARAGYMREVVMPGMARILRRPPYDFTQPYAYNRSRLAFGCYHCHRVK